MNMTQFRKMLSIHGTDFSRWDGTTPAEAKEFMESSEQAQALYKQTQALDAALDSFGADAVDPALLDRVMQRIDGEQNAEAGEETNVRPFTVRKKTPLVMRPVFWGGLASAAASVILFMGVINGPHSIPVQQHGTVVAANTAPKNQQGENVETVLAALDNLTEEEVAQQEIIGLWQTADAGAAVTDADIDSFLDEILPVDTGTQDQAPQQPPQNQPQPADDKQDLWQLFMESQGTRQL